MSDQTIGKSASRFIHYKPFMWSLCSKLREEQFEFVETYEQYFTVHLHVHPNCDIANCGHLIVRMYSNIMSSFKKKCISVFKLNFKSDEIFP